MFFVDLPPQPVTISTPPAIYAMAPESLGERPSYPIQESKPQETPEKPVEGSGVTVLKPDTGTLIEENNDSGDEKAPEKTPEEKEEAEKHLKEQVAEHKKILEKYEEDQKDNNFYITYDYSDFDDDIIALYEQGTTEGAEEIFNQKHKATEEDMKEKLGFKDKTYANPKGTVYHVTDLPILLPLEDFKLFGKDYTGSRLGDEIPKGYRVVAREYLVQEEGNEVFFKQLEEEKLFTLTIKSPEQAKAGRVEFTITKPDGTKQKVYVSDADGEDVKLPEGTYKVQETQSVQGFVPVNKEAVTVTFPYKDKDGKMHDTVVLDMKAKKDTNTQNTTTTNTTTTTAAPQTKTTNTKANPQTGDTSFALEIVGLGGMGVIGGAIAYLLKKKKED